MLTKEAVKMAIRAIVLNMDDLSNLEDYNHIWNTEITIEQIQEVIDHLKEVIGEY